jgi:hypothetical protein
MATALTTSGKLTTVACLAVASLLTAVLSGCSGPTYNPPAGSDTSPSNLTVEMLVDETAQQLAPGPPTSSVDVSIYFGLNGQSGVEFNQGETVTCGSTTLGFFLGRYHATLSGWTNPLICNYNRNGAATPISGPVAQLPLPTFPTVGSNVPRTANLTLTYTVVPNSIGVRVRTDPNLAPDGAFQAETGSLVFDASQQTAGPGVFTLERRVKTNPAGSGFKSLSTTSDSDASVLVKWV